jgi:hypothetical protein
MHYTEPVRTTPIPVSCIHKTAPRKAYAFDVATTLKSRRRRSLTSSPQDIAQNGFRNISRDGLRACVVNAWTRYAVCLVGICRAQSSGTIYFEKIPRRTADAKIIVRRRIRSLPNSRASSRHCECTRPFAPTGTMEYRELSTSIALSHLGSTYEDMPNRTCGALYVVVNSL